MQALFNLAGNVAAVTDGGGVHASKMALRLARGNRRRHPDGNKTAAEKRTAEVDSTGRRRLAGRVDASQQGIRRLPLRRSREPSRACASSSRRRAPTAGRRFLKSPANNGSASSPSKVFSCTAAEASLIQIARFLARKWRRSASGATPSVRSSSRPGKTGSCSRKSRWPASCGTLRWAGSESPASSPRGRGRSWPRTRRPALSPARCHRWMAAPGHHRSEGGRNHPAQILRLGEIPLASAQNLRGVPPEALPCDVSRYNYRETGLNFLVGAWIAWGRGGLDCSTGVIIYGGIRLAD